VILLPSASAPLHLIERPLLASPLRPEISREISSLNKITVLNQVKNLNITYFNLYYFTVYGLRDSTEAGISVNLGHPQGRALRSTLNFLGRIPCLSLIGIDL
jgi:hypothetical protein